MKFVQIVNSLDRRWIFLAITLSVAIPILSPIGLPIGVSGSSTAFYETLDALPDGSTVLISADYDPTAKPELYPMHIALLRHMQNKQHKVILMALWPVGPEMHRNALKETFDIEGGMEYGIDYVNLGYQPGNIAVIQGIGESFRNYFNVDIQGTNLDDLPLMRNIKNLEDVDVAVTISAGFPGTPQWVQIAGDQYNTPILGGTTAVSAPQLFPYFPEQISGFLAGMKGAAEYEAQIEMPAAATSGMDAQSIAHVMIVIFVIIGNVAYFLERSMTKGRTV